jgi:hypothetical protein
MANSFGLRDYRLEVDGDGLRGLGTTEQLRALVER